MELTIFQIDKESGKPISAQLVDCVLNAIEEKKLLPGDRLPTERSLAESFGIARGTVKTAYRKLEAMNLIESRQGSGSFVRRDEGLPIKMRKKKAVGMITDTIAALRELGLATEEIHQLMDICLARGEKGRKSLNVALIYDNPEMLLDFKRQLSYLPGVYLSIFILESITEDRSPEKLLQGFDIIITPTGLFQRIVELLPGLKDRVMEAAITPAAETLVEITALPRGSRIGIISRTNVFLAVVKESLLSFGFREERILSFFEMNYTIDTYFPGGIDVLISFSDAHIFTNPDFDFRNEEFLQKGGKLIVFQHQIERGTLIYIEDRVRRMLNQKS